MTPGIKRGWGDIFKLYSSLSMINKITIGAVLTATVAAFAYLIFFSEAVSYDYLFTDISRDNAGEIIKHLKEKNIPFKAEERAILVPRQNVHELRMELAAQGLPQGKGIGFEIFDTQKLGTSDFVQQLNMKRALQGELARTISQIEKVELARVHLVMPKRALFKEDEIEPSASVVLRLGPGQNLEKSEIRAIVHLVSSAVEGLSSKYVTIIDSSGKLLSKAIGDEEQIWGSSPLEYKAKIELEMANRVEELVSHVVGVGKVIAKITVELDFKKEEKTEEIYDPDTVVVRSEKRVKENRNNAEQESAGAPGAQSSTPAGPLTGGRQESTSARERDLTNYEINKVVRHTIRAAGDLKRVSVAVLVDGTYTQQEVNGKIVKTYKPRTDEEILKIEEVVKRIVGFSHERGDAIQVTNVPFETSILAEEAYEPSFLEKYDFIPQFLRYGIILALAIVMIFFLFKPLVEWVISFHEEERLRELEKEQEDVVKTMEEQLIEVRRTIETSTVEYKKKLIDVVQDAPDLVTNVLRAWINIEE